MTDQLIVERGGLEKKDKSELQSIVTALGGRPSSRARKADLIDQIMELAQGPATDEASTSDTSSTSATNGSSGPDSTAPSDSELDEPAEAKEKASPASPAPATADARREPASASPGEISLTFDRGSAS